MEYSQSHRTFLWVQIMLCVTLTGLNVNEVDCILCMIILTK